ARFLVTPYDAGADGRRKLLLLHLDDECEKRLAGLDHGLMRYSRRHYQDIASSHFLGLSTYHFGPTDLAIAGVMRPLDLASIEYGRFASLDNEDVGPVLVKLSRSAGIASQNLKLVVT